MTSIVFTDIPSAYVDVTIPAGTRGRILVRFTGESSCSGGLAAQWCSVRILVAGVEAQPAVGINFAFDSTDGNTESGASWESHALDRISPVLEAGTYTVQAQWAVTNGGTTFFLDDWTLTAQRVVA